MIGMVSRRAIISRFHHYHDEEDYDGVGGEVDDDNDGGGHDDYDDGGGSGSDDFDKT